MVKRHHQLQTEACMKGHWRRASARIGSVAEGTGELGLRGGVECAQTGRKECSKEREEYRTTVRVERVGRGQTCRDLRNDKLRLPVQQTGSP